MRRLEFSVSEEQEITQFLAESTFGFLGTVGQDGWPHVTPLNYVYHNGSIYFHGSKIGQKMKDIARTDQVAFSVAKEYALIPSYFLDPKLACPATSYFKSVVIRGFASVLDDLPEKAQALTAFMEKLQPEGGYEPIDSEQPEYMAAIKGVAVVKITVDSLSAKFKFGQNLKEARFDQVTEGLQQRGDGLDEETVNLMKKYCPHHKEK